jgi:hypothetical protein
MILKINLETEKIERIDEYYNKRWDDGIREEEYTIMKAASMKS